MSNIEKQKFNDLNKKETIKADIRNLQTRLQHRVQIVNPKMENRLNRISSIILKKCIYQNRIFFGTALPGYNVSILAYDQTSSGKSYTMITEVVPVMTKHIFNQYGNGGDLVKCSMVEICGTDMKNLLTNPSSKSNLMLHFAGNEGSILGLVGVPLQTFNEFHTLYEKGLSHRTVSSTAMNTESSRSHVIYTLVLFIFRGDRQLSYVLSNWKRPTQPVQHRSKPNFRDAALTKLLRFFLSGNTKHY